MYGIFAAMSILDAIIFNFYIKEHISPSYMAKNGRSHEMKDVLNIYLHPQAAESIIEESNAFHEELKKRKMNTMIKNRGKKSNFFKKYRPELIQSIIVAIVFNLCFFNVFGTYSIFMITEDMSDGDEVARSSFLLSLASFFDLSVKLVTAYFNLLKRRKCSMMTALTAYGLVQLLNGYFQLNGLWHLSKFIPFFAFGTIGGIGLNSYFPYMAEFFSGKMIGIVNANNLVVWTIYGLIIPNLDPKKNDNEYIHLFSLVFGIGSIMGAIGVYFLFYETYGRERSEFFKLLRKNSMRKAQFKN